MTVVLVWGTLAGEIEEKLVEVCTSMVVALRVMEGRRAERTSLSSPLYFASAEGHKYRLEEREVIE